MRCTIMFLFILLAVGCASPACSGGLVYDPGRGYCVCPLGEDYTRSGICELRDATANGGDTGSGTLDGSTSVDSSVDAARATGNDATAEDAASQSVMDADAPAPDAALFDGATEMDASDAIDSASAVDAVSPLDSATPTSTPDSGHPDSGRPDSGRPDSGQLDSGRPDSGQLDSGRPDSGPPPVDAGVDACVPRVETCNGRDDDCNGVVDDNGAQSSCTAAHTTGAACSAGQCVVTGCASGWENCNGNFADGCEVRLGTIEACGGCGMTCGWACENGTCNDAVDVAVGGKHACAVRQDGTVWCWGNNDQGQLANPIVNGSNYLAPIRASVSAGMQAVYAANDTTCATDQTRRLWCWGQTYRVGEVPNQANPRFMLSPANSVGLASAHGCAVQNFSVMCWGNAPGIGGTQSYAATPRAAFTGNHVASGESHSCAIASNSTLSCWGDNAHGQLGVPTSSTASSTTPVAVPGLTGVISVVAGTRHTCALTQNGIVQCFGQSSTPTGMDPANGAVFSPATSIAAAGFSTCAINNAGQIRCAGGLGFFDASGVPPARKVAVGLISACAVTTAGAVYCWGSNLNGQLGADYTGTSAVRVAAPMAP